MDVARKLKENKIQKRMNNHVNEIVLWFPGPSQKPIRPFLSKKNPIQIPTFPFSSFVALRACPDFVK